MEEDCRGVGLVFFKLRVGGLGLAEVWQGSKNHSEKNSLH